MQKSIYLLLVATAAYALTACDASKKTTKVEEKVIERTMPEVIVTDTKIDKAAAPKVYSLAEYNPSAKRLSDLIHTQLEVGFDWEKQHLIGKATITAKPYFYPSDLLVLDARGFDIKSVGLQAKKAVSKLKYAYDGEKLNITLDRVYKNTEEYTIVIEYVAKPEERKSIGGSAAITSDKGLYFINPKGEEKNKPKQIWTQGETESSSYWFPTIDKPNERCTQEIYITVEDKYKTLSNGVMLSSKKNADGTRTDYWKMDKPHAPYLFMMAVGEFAVVKDKWRDREMLYYVEPAYEKDAKAIYNNAPEIIEFFSTRLGVEYPWSKMAHIIVRDYVSGAMENTSAIVYGDFCQKNARELMDAPNDNIIAHETFHHWFGDLVTCESWSNLTVNESFANYSEYLWQEYKYGRDAADEHLLEDFQGYVGQSRGGKNHPLVHFGYHDREDMFDAISYNKGGCTLHQLRKYLGDDAFFAGLKEYLTTNQYSTGEAHQLRLAFEKTTGEDLSWYFNQWYFNQGHPTLDIAYAYDGMNKKMNVTIKQTQDPEKFLPIYELYLDTDIYNTEKDKSSERIHLTKREETFSFDAPTRPKLVNIDAQKSMVGTKKDNHTDEEWLFQFYHAPLYLDRLESIKALKSKASSNPLVQKMLADALNDPFQGIREMVLSSADLKNSDVTAKIASLATTDPAPKVRAAALSTLAETKNAAYLDLAKKAVANTKESYGVVSAGLQLLQALDASAALAAAKSLENEKVGSLLEGVGKIYAGTGDQKYRSFFESRFDIPVGASAMGFIENYLELLKKAPVAEQLTGAKTLEGMATDMGRSLYLRFGSARAVKELRDSATGDTQKALQVILDNIKAKETSKMLQGYYSGF